MLLQSKNHFQHAQTSSYFIIARLYATQKIFWRFGKWKSKIRVTKSNPRITRSNARVTRSNLRVTSSNLWVTSSKPRVRRLEAQVARLKARVGRLKARVERLKAQVRRLKAQVEAIKPRATKQTYELKDFWVQNIEFQELQKVLLSLLSECWTYASHEGFEKNLFHNITLKKRIWPLYYHHNLLTGKLRSIDLNKS